MKLVLEFEGRTAENVAALAFEMGRLPVDAVRALVIAAATMTAEEARVLAAEVATPAERRAEEAYSVARNAARRARQRGDGLRELEPAVEQFTVEGFQRMYAAGATDGEIAVALGVGRNRVAVTRRQLNLPANAGWR